MRIDKGVAVGIDFFGDHFFDIVIISQDRCQSRCNRCSSGLTIHLGVEWGSFLTSGSDVVTFEDSETILAGGIFDGEDLAIVTDVRILTNSVALSIGFFSEKLTIFCGKS